MKKLKMTILGAVTLLLALTLNFRHALSDYGILDGKLHIEVLAQSTNTSEAGSSSGNASNPWYQWPFQGATQDERELFRDCPTSSSSSGGGSAGGGNQAGSGSAGGNYSHSQTNPTTRRELSCPYGSVNCSSLDC